MVRRVRRSRTSSRTGHALTVFKSPRITRFGIRLTNNYPQGGIAGTDLILGRAFGPIIDRIGGVPFGASGSPVYINNEVVGAVSQLLSSDARLIGITPIADMLALVHEPSLQNTTYTEDHELRVGHPLVVVGNGFRMEKVKAELSRHFKSFITIAANSSNSVRQKQALQPGGLIGVALMTGDLKLGFIGTVTLVNGAQVFAFGHPLLFAGPTNIPMTTAEVLETATGQFPSKIGILGETVGTVIQDRAAGVLGVLNQAPQELVSMQFTVNDLDRDRVEIIRTEAVHIPTELPFLTFSAALETIFRAMNRTGAGTAQWEWTIGLASSENITLQQEQYDPFNIAYTIAGSIFSLLEEPLAAGLRVLSVELNVVVTMANTLD